MPGKRGGGENSKRAAGQARKAEAVANKKIAKEREAEAAESQKWQQGSKDTSKREATAAKAAEAARKKAERAALEAEEMASLKSAKVGNSKSAQKKTAGPSRGLDLAQLDIGAPSTGTAALNASGIDNALDALSITTGAKESVDRHPERRFKAAYTQFETRRLEEMKDDKTLRRQQKVELIRKEFEKSPDNPFNQLSATYNSTKEEMDQLRTQERNMAETRLVSSP